MLVFEANCIFTNYLTSTEHLEGAANFLVNNFFYTIETFYKKRKIRGSLDFIFIYK